MKIFNFKSASFKLFLYFFILSLFGTVLFLLPIAYVDNNRMNFIDCLFNSVSALCVTGLCTVDMKIFSDIGLLFFMFLIEAGGLGLVTFFILFLFFSYKELSLSNRNIIKEYFVDEYYFDSRKIVKLILATTLAFQLIGGLIISLTLYFTGYEKPFFYGMFLAISAFCNAGFSPYSDSLILFNNNYIIIFVISFLIIAGGLGFTVFSNIVALCSKRKNRIRVLSLHTKVVLMMTTILIFAGTILIFLLEKNNAFSNMTFIQKICNSFFQSVTLRTAGFELVPQSSMTDSSYFISIIFMLIGGSPGSMAGGIKTTTIFVLLFYVYKSSSDRNSPSIFKRDIKKQGIEKALSVFIMALSFLVIMMFLLILAEQNNILKTNDLKDLIFEGFSAFGTVGLSRGITSKLSVLGKIIIIVMMFAGRTGITFIALNSFTKSKNIKSFTDYPEENILIG